MVEFLASKDKKRSLQQSEARLGILLMLPTIILIGAVVIYPIIYNVIMSFYKVSMNPKRPNTFLGIENYIDLFTDPNFYRSLLVTMIYVAITVIGSTIVGLLMALLLNNPFKGRKIVRSLILMPYVAPMIASVYVWQYMFNGIYGVVNYFSVDILHIFETAPLWFDHPISSVVLVVLFDIWRVFPYSFLMILAALQAIDRNIYEAAEVDGASAWRKFWAITFPGILPSIVAVITLRTIWNFYKFDDVFLFTKNVPILGVYLYQTAFAAHDSGRAAAITIILFLMVFSFVVFFGRKVVRK